MDDFSPAPSLAGTIVDRRYRVDQLVGQGGFGEVYSAFHLTLGTPVAIKLLRLPPGATQEQTAELIGRFLSEGRLLPRLRHPNIVAALDLGTVEVQGIETPYLVMEWCDGHTLGQELSARTGAGFPLPEAWQIMSCLVDAVAHAHSQGIVHRDLKPANVMLTRDPNGSISPRVIDFGIAKMATFEAPGTGETPVSSWSPFTPGYAAPEQVSRSRTGPWTDVHALGLIFVELVTGRPPYGRERVLGAAVAPQRPTARTHGIDIQAFEPVIGRALALRPADRYRDAIELRNALHFAAHFGATQPAEPQIVLASAPTASSPMPDPHGPTLQSTALTAAYGARPRRLADLGSDELVARLAATGADITFVRKRPGNAMLTFQQHGASGQIYLITVSENQPLHTLLPDSAFTYARDGDTVVVASGDLPFTDPNFLGRLLYGVPVVIESHVP